MKVSYISKKNLVDKVYLDTNFSQVVASKICIPGCLYKENSRDLQLMERPPLIHDHWKKYTYRIEANIKEKIFL